MVGKINSVLFVEVGESQSECMYQHPVVLVQYFTNLMRHQQIDTDSFLVYSSSRLRIEMAALENTVPRLLRHRPFRVIMVAEDFSFATVVVFK